MVVNSHDGISQQNKVCEARVIVVLLATLSLLQLVSWSLTSLFSTNMAISETKLTPVVDELSKSGTNRPSTLLPVKDSSIHVYNTVPPSRYENFDGTDNSGLQAFKSITRDRPLEGFVPAKLKTV